MSDESIAARIERLVAEEHELRPRGAALTHQAASRRGSSATAPRLVGTTSTGTSL
jgi:hypothetical protein